MASLPPTHGQLLRGPKPARDPAADRRYDATRAGDVARKVRSSARWDKVRKLQLVREPLCADHLARGRAVAATQVDHVVPIRKDPRLAFDRTNMRSLCTQCHARKSREERRA